MKKLWILIVIGILIRIILSSVTFHPDMQVFNLAGKLIASGNILNLYDYQANLLVNDPVKTLAVLNYPPAVYFFHGIFNFLFGTVLGMPQMNQFLLGNAANYGNIQFNIHLALLKIPYLIFDLLAGLVLFKLLESTKKPTIALTLWLFNPISLYATYMMGQFDIIPTFFIILSVYFAVKSKLKLAALALGFGIAFKLFPIFLLIPLIILGKNYWEKFKLFIIATTPYLLSILPYISSHNFRTNALFANQSSKSLYAMLPVSGGEAIIYFPLFLLFFYLIIWHVKLKVSLWRLYLIPLLLFFIFTHFHPQWLIWIVPLLILELIYSSFRNLILSILIYLSWFALLFFFDPSLTVGIFSPIAPALNNLPSIWSLLNINIDYNLSRSLIQTVFASASLFLIYQSLVIKKDD